MRAQVREMAEGLPRELMERVVSIDDPDADAFRRDCLVRPHGPVRMWARRTMGRFVSQYDANALLGTHDMHLLGTGAWRRLLEAGGWAPDPTARLLDVGAGDGRVTAPLAALFGQVATTEVSGPMVKRLRRRGWGCHRVDLAWQSLPEPGPFHAVALLNVLDRTDRPLTLLARARNLVPRGGRVLVACPFPMDPHVRVGPDTFEPDEPLPTRGSSWAEGVTAFARAVLEPAGLQVRALARVPYLSRGTWREPVQALDDAVFVCSPV